MPVKKGGIDSFTKEERNRRVGTAAERQRRYISFFGEMYLL